jgi:hypothetical protein
MRRLIVETKLEDISSSLLGRRFLNEIKTLEIVSLLKATASEVAMICRLELKDPNSSLQEILGGQPFKTQLLEAKS